VYAPNARFRLAGHTGSVLDVATGGDHALAVGADGTMLLWDITSGDLIHDFDLDGAVAHSVALSADGRAAATGLFDGRVLLWDMESRGLIRSFEGHRDVVTDVAFSPDETRILSVSLDRSLRLWDATSGDELLAVETPGALLRVAFSPDSRSAASSSADLTAAPNHPPEERDRTIRVWDLETGQEIQRFEPRSGFVRAIDFSPDGAYILSGTWNAAEEGTLQLWNIASGQLERRIYGAHTDIVSDVRFSADGRRILSASWDRSIRLWDAATGLELRRLEGHQDRVLRVAFTPDESHVLAGVGNIGNNIPVPANDNPADTSLWVWDLLNRAEIHRLNDHRDWVWSVAVSADGRTAATGAGPFNVLAARPDEPDTSVRLWDVTSGALLHTLTGHTDTVHSVAFMPDGARLLSGGWDGTLRLWDVTSGALLSAFEADAGRVYSVMPSSDGGQALAATGEGGILLLALDDDGQMHTLRAYEGHSDLVNRAVFSPDESLIASASRDGTVRLWHAASGQEIRLLEGHTAEVNDVRFSPDGRYLLSASWDGTVRLWDTASGEEVRQMVGHTRPVFGVAFSPDGATALTGSSDMSVRLWDVATGEEIRRFDGHTNWVLDVAYSPAGDYIITAAEDNTARIWQMARTPDDLIEWARANRYITELTCPERAQYRVYPLCDEPGS
jgi:WD40 repeat protein